MNNFVYVKKKKHVDLENKSANERTILLTLLPYWTPLIPPLGIASLKGHLSEQNYNMKLIDVNIEIKFKIIYEKYFNKLKENIEETKQGNFINTGNDVMLSHMMLYMTLQDDDWNEFKEALSIIVEKNYFVTISDEAIHELIEIINEFYFELENYFLKVLREFKPAILGLSTYRGTLPASMFVARLAKKVDPSIINLMGGTIFSQELTRESPDFQDFIQKVDYIDKIFIGEGEMLWQKYLEGSLDDRKVFSLEDINNEVIDVDKMKLPDFSDFNLQFYPYTSYHGSRSCPYQCKFCAETVNWGKYRKKSAVNAVAEMTELYQKHKKQIFLLCDSLLNPLINQLSEEFIKSGTTLYWDGYLKVDKDVCDKEKVLMWRRGGFYRARLGIESGSQKILDEMDKRITIEQIKRAIINLAEAGIKTTTYWIIGYPGETEEDFQLTLDLIEELKDYLYEAEPNQFRYFYSGQVNSDEWKNSSKFLYQGTINENLIIKPRFLNQKPEREVVFDRLGRFVLHCKKLGLANPYSMLDIYRADQRWKELHKSSVPGIADFDECYITECEEVG